ncbi:MAG: response regulator [Desulfomonilia bacterium]|jgi:two-component system cell cycle sensor histidine kinase/response regulator CckA|uniref:Chemotaxis protein CheY n=1 Tax=anaerobic digester metagenome TaxID=1263854 RepID=A0A485M6S2_9ZZZZ|nr:response regulator [Pseudomonadota bacterium]HON37717.1 response regulator [Deltaproteobacteria bacterium]HRS55188.1 response regulator [Desulfomonilia bacterium]HPD20354.1 response regulator [Deltaproteobacteria bacterium]HPX17189.1 response regulator [Deltaproteobacteria bacterium]
MGNGKILVMDDEEIIQDVLSNMLDFLGYEVQVAAEGSQAVQMYREAMESGNPFDAVIMDLTIPGGVGGKDAIRDLLKIDPQAKAIVSSGYSTDPVVTNYQEHGFKGVIHKPFKIEELKEAIQKVV